MNIKELPKGTALYEYNQLSLSAKEIARKEIIAIGLQYYNIDLNKYKAKSKNEYSFLY